MLDTLSSQESLYEDQGQAIDLAYVIGLLKRRAFQFTIPFLIVALLGFAVTEFQKPIYRADSKLLVESSSLSAVLLQPTVRGGVVDEQFEVFKDRVLSPENLFAAVDKFNLFPATRDSMSGYQLIELMRKRVSIKPAPFEMQPNARTTAFSVSFDYEVPSVALKVVNEFVTEIVSEDTTDRNATAAQTTKILEDQINGLKNEYDSVATQIETLKQRSPDLHEADSEGTKSQIKSLATLEADLAEKSSVYSDEHPVIKKLKKDIATLKHLIAAAPQRSATAELVDKGDTASQVLELRQTLLAKNLDDARNKLATARLGETLEKNQQAEHLRIIQHPELQAKPVAPAKLKWIGSSLALATFVGAGIALVAELLDTGIRGRKELAAIIDQRLIVSIPYIFIPGEQRRRRWKLILFWLILVMTSAAISATIVKFSHSGLLVN